MWSNLLFLHYGIALLVLFFFFVKRREDVLPSFLLLLAIPFFSWGILYYLQRSKHKDAELPEWLLRKETYEDMSLQRPDLLNETNMISLQDALILNSNQVKRKTLMNVLKNDFLQQAPLLAAALKSEDNETSHYAATALQQAKSLLAKQLRHIERELTERPNDLDVMIRYLTILKQMIDMEFLDRHTQLKYTYSYLHALTAFIELGGTIDPEYHIERIQIALSLGEYEQALSASELFLVQHPRREQAYFEAMHVHYAMKNVTQVHHLVDALRASDIRLSPEGLQQLRFWI